MPQAHHGLHRGAPPPIGARPTLCPDGLVPAGRPTPRLAHCLHLAGALAVRLSRAGFEDALSQACLSEFDAALHAYVGGNYKLSFLYSHPMDGKKVGTRPADKTGTAALPAGDVNKTDQFVVQAQAKF